MPNQAPIPSIAAERFDAPTDEDFDDMLHALGRPKRPDRDCYRNYYCLPAESEQARRFEALGCWDFIRRINGGRDAIYSVNGVGKQALAEWMKARTKENPHGQ